MTVADMCEKTQLFPADKCHKKIDNARRAPRPHEDVTWEQLMAIDPHFTRAAMAMAHRYGYEDVIPAAIEGLDDEPA